MFRPLRGVSFRDVLKKLAVVINCTSDSGEGKQKCPSLHDGAFSVHYSVTEACESQTENLCETIGLCHQRRVGQFKLITLFFLGNQGYIAACDLTRHHLADRPSMVTLLDTGSKQCLPHR